MSATFFGHPRGLATLFFTEMWERFTFYGMRAVLVLFLVATVASGGLGLDDKTAAAIYGLYNAGVYLAALPGGWVADRLIGAQRAVMLGGAGDHRRQSAAGNLHQRRRVSISACVVIVLGVGLLKPNVSAIVAGLYPEGGARLDSAFTIFYIGINVGGALGTARHPAGAESTSDCARDSASAPCSWSSACCSFISRAGIWETPGCTPHPSMRPAARTPWCRAPRNGCDLWIGVGSVGRWRSRRP